MSYVDELEIVKSVYCRDGEFSEKVSGNAILKGFSLNFNECAVAPETNTGRRMCISFHFPDNYPEKPPHIDITSPKITKANIKKFNEDLERFVTSADLLNSYMMLEVISWVRENASRFLCSEKGSDNNESPRQVCTMRLDHMRAKKSYLKTLQKWTEQLNLCGEVIFYKQFIILIVEGFEYSVEEFIKRLRTRRVDTDSCGHACKERMMTILSKSAHTSGIISEGFSVHEVSSLEEVHNIFQHPTSQDFFFSVLKPAIT